METSRHIASKFNLKFEEMEDHKTSVACDVHAEDKFVRCDECQFTKSCEKYADGVRMLAWCNTFQKKGGNDEQD